jgi:iron complex outermembrane receptor protein
VADERTGSLKLDGGGGAWAWSLGALVRDTDDYEIPGAAEAEGLHEEEEGEEEHEEEGDFGVLANSDIRSGQGHLGVTRFFGDKGFFGVAVSGFETDYGVPGGAHEHEHEEEGEEHEEEGEEGGIRIDMRQRRVDLNGEITRPLGAFRGLRTRFGIVDYEHDEVEPGGEVGTTFFNEAWEGRLELVQKERGSLSGSVGLQLGVSDLEAVGAEAFIPPVESESLAVFAFEEIAKGRLTYQFGGRFERQETTTSAADLPDRDFDGVSASLGVVGRVTDGWALGGSLSRAVKMPAGEELYAFGPHFATRVFEVGDPDLEEEVSVGVDLFVRRTAGRLTGELHVFRNDFADYIFQTFTGEEEDDLPVTRFAQADAGFTGAELTATLELWEKADHHLDLDFLADLVRAELDDGGDLPRIPPSRLGLGISYRSSSWLARVEVRDADDQDRVAENETPTDGYTLVNAHVGYRFILGNQLLDVMLRGRNLGDETARNHVSFLKDSVPLPGRDIGLAIRYSF